MADKTQPVLVTTKTMVPPTRSAWVLRSRLLARMEADSGLTLILVRAPAGCGKSTLLAQLAHQAVDRPVGWVTLDEGDNDPVLFWRYVSAALRSAVPGFAESAWDDLSGPSPDLKGRAIPDMVNALAALHEPLLLVLDDYHRIEDPEVHATLRQFLVALPRSAQVAIATRKEPGFAVPRLRAYGLVQEITAADLSFSHDETSEALRRLDHHLPDEIATELHTRTEGWATGVYLATRSRQVNPTKHLDPGMTNVAVREFLMDEMLAQLPSGTRAFVRDISVLDEFSGELCDYVAETTGSASMLADLARSNLLLIPLDDEGVWFRHHHLLRDILRSELSATMPDRQRHLHSRACEWFQRNEAPSEAIHHAVESGDVAGAAELVAANFWPVLTNGRLATGSRWIARLPQSLIEEYPPLTVCASYIAAFGGDFPLAYRLCELATAARFEGAPPDGTTSHESSVALLRGALYPAGVSDALHYATSAYRLEPPGSPWKRTSAAVLGGALLANGDFAEASEILAEAADGAEPQPAIRSYALGQTALLECWRGDSLRARDSVDRAVQLIERFRLANSATSAPAFAVAAALAARSGRPDSARRHQDMAEAAASQGFPDLLLEVSVVNAETSLGLGDPARAAWDLAIGAKALTVLGDGGYYADRLAPLLAEVDGVVPQKRGRALGDALTARERQILTLLETDLTVREIGHQLYISRNTAKTHVARIFRKLGCKTREDAVAIAHDRGLL